VTHEKSEGIMFAIRHLLSSALTLSGLLSFAPAVFAQAWVPAPGEGAVSLSVQDLNVKKHLSAGTLRDGGHINTVVVLTDVTYGVTDKFAVDLAVPVVSSAYSGLKPHPGTDIDNGKFHTSLTDLRFSVRYNVTRKGAVFTPYVGSIIPSHDYPFYGHAAAGERLKELQVGAFVAKLFTSGVPGMFVSSRVAYGFVQKVEDISHNKSMGDLEVGYFVTPSFRAFATANGAYTHGGIDFPLAGLAALPLRYQPVHDIVQRVNYLHAGGGFAYSISDSVDLFGSFSRLVAGRNGHALNRGITLGASWNFSRQSARRTAAAGTGAPPSEYTRTVARREGSLARCVCQKSGN
jgi:hypothetical protein